MGATQSENDNNAMEIRTDTTSSKKTHRRCVRTSPYGDEEFYLKVVFSYHDIHKLMNLGLANRDGTPIERTAAPAPLPDTPAGSQPRDAACTPSQCRAAPLPAGW